MTKITEVTPKKRRSKKTKKAESIRPRGGIRGGVKLENSECCGANVNPSQGGLRLKYCSKCGGDVSRTRY